MGSGQFATYSQQLATYSRLKRILEPMEPWTIKGQGPFPETL